MRTALNQADAPGSFPRVWRLTLSLYMAFSRFQVAMNAARLSAPVSRPPHSLLPALCPTGMRLPCTTGCWWRSGACVCAFRCARRQRNRRVGSLNYGPRSLPDPKWPPWGSDGKIFCLNEDGKRCYSGRREVRMTRFQRPWRNGPGNGAPYRRSADSADRGSPLLPSQQTP
jgi:hypothetical protein